jgi:hypothetical protein
LPFSPFRPSYFIEYQLKYTLLDGVHQSETYKEEMKAKLVGVRKVNIQPQKTIANPRRYFGPLEFWLSFGRW